MIKVIIIFSLLGIVSCGKEEVINNDYEELYKIKSKLDNSYAILKFFSNFNKGCGFDEV